MIERKTGDILTAEAEALVNTVNCVGIMGRGIALQFRKAFPENFKAYQDACDRGVLRPGRVLVHDMGRLVNPRYIINFPTKRHWKGKSRMEDIEAGLKALVAEIRSRGIRSVAVPPLGCGLGGLDWEDVRPRIESAFRELLDVEVLLYEPKGAPAAVEMVKMQESPRMTVARAALLILMRRYLSAVMDPFVSLLEIHKLMYFMQEAGENLKLRYEKGIYGPYAKNLRHLLIPLEGHFLTGYGDAEDKPEKAIELQPGIEDAAGEYLNSQSDTVARLQRVVGLIEGFETPYGMELLSTVHWVGSHEGATTADEAVEKTYAWNERKRIFQEKHIRRAWDVLKSKGWLSKN